MGRKAIITLASLTLMTWTGCGDSDVGDESGHGGSTLVETVIKPQLVVIGQSVGVSCPVFSQVGDLVDIPTRFTVTPEIVPVGSTITPSEAGTYTVRCETTDGRLSDATPAVLHVLHPDDIDKVVVDTELAKGQAAIGEDVAVTCDVALDGKLLANVATGVTTLPETGIEVSDHIVRGLKDGDFDISCYVPNTAFFDKSPAVLVVGEGGAKPAKVTTSLEEHIVKSGDQVAVTCTVMSDKGTLMDLPTVVEVPAGIAVEDHTLSAQQVGDFEITCSLAQASGSVERIPDTLTVTAGTAIKVEAWADPQKDVYKPGDKITIKWQGIDAFENPVPAPAGSVSAPNQGVTKLEPAKYELLADGYYTFTVTLTDAPQPSTDVELIVDGSGPVVTVTYPERGQTFDGDGVIEATGTVHDEFGGLKSIIVNGYPVMPAEDGTWSLTVESVHGVNPLIIEALDVHDNPSNVSLAWYYSTGWVTADKDVPDDAWIDNSVRVWLSQTIIDDGDHTEAKIDDLAHLLEILLNNVDFAQMLGKPALLEQVTPDLINEPDFLGLGIHLQGDLIVAATVEEVTFGKATVALDSRDGGVDMDAKFIPDADGPGLKVFIKVSVTLDLQATASFDVGGFIIPVTADINPPPSVFTFSGLTMDYLDLETAFDIHKLPGQPLEVVGKGLKVIPQGSALSPLEQLTIVLGKVEFWTKDPVFGNNIKVGEFDLGSVDLTSLVSGLNDIFKDLSGLIIDNVLGFATQVLEPLVAQVGGDALAMALSSLEIDQGIDLPEFVPGQPPGAISIKAKLSQVQFTNAGATIGLAGAAVAEKKVDRNPLGSILRDQCLGVDGTEYQLPKTGAMEFALALDLMNEVLYSLWYNGGLAISLDAAELTDLASMGISKATIELDPLLPPILDDCNSKGTLKMQLGDSHLDVDVQLGDVPVQFKAWLTAEIDVGVVAQGQSVGIKVNGVSQFELQIYDVEGPFKGNEIVLEKLIETVLLEQLLGALTGGALSSFPVPEFNIGGLIEGTEEDIIIELGELGVKKSGGFIQIEGTLQ